MLERAGLKPEPLRINFLRSDIPISRGLGSSSALLVGGVIAANALHSLGMNRDELFSLATALEGTRTTSPRRCSAASPPLRSRPVFPSPSVIRSVRCCIFTALVPPYELSTALSRRVLPHDVPRADAIFNVSRAALLISALGSGDVKLLRAAMADRLHEP